MASTTFMPQNEDKKLLKEEFGIGPYKIDDLNDNLMLLDELFHDTKVLPNRLQLDEFDIYKD
ncbi:hypothetical protein [Clostridium subterminale]|uniref:Uncharacterized protein n=1 Tax=Clostridium subterminale TaxID=1550 RepID=A0ABN1KZ97_CLOSU